MKHNCEQVVLGLSEKLRARARHVVFLLGAGASCAGNLPSLAGLKDSVAKELINDQRAQFEKLGQSRNLEEILTRLRLVAEALSGTAQTIESLNSEAARALNRAICTAIAKVVTNAAVDITHHERFAQWAGSSQYDRAVEIVPLTTIFSLRKVSNWLAPPISTGGRAPV